MVKSLWQNRHFGTVVPLMILLLWCTTAMAAQIGGLSGAYLRGPAGATALSMGGAWSAKPDYLAAWWNPSVIVLDKEKIVAVGTGVRSLGRADAFASYHFRVPPRLGLGVAIVYRGDPFINEIRDPDENIVGKGVYTSFTTKIGLSYLFSKKLVLGGSLGILYQNLPAATDEYKIRSSSVSSIGAIDLSASYRVNDKWRLAAIIRNLGANMEWSIQGDPLSSLVNEYPLVPVVLASTYKTTLSERPFIWSIDVSGYLIDSKFDLIDHTELHINNGVEWQYWDEFSFRAGIGDLFINRNTVYEFDKYQNEFAMVYALGISWDGISVKDGLKVNYGVSTDKLWAGIDQQLDITLSF